MSSNSVTYKSGATFTRRCPQCGRYVKPDDSVWIQGADEQPAPKPNATCTKCGRVRMEFEGYY